MPVKETVVTCIGEVTAYALRIRRPGEGRDPSLPHKASVEKD
jgi:hypothetical protein